MPFAFSTVAGAPESPTGWERLRALPGLTHLAVVYRPSGETPPEAIVPHLARLLPSADAHAATIASGGADGSGADGAREGPMVPALALVLVQVAGAKKDASFAAEAVKAMNTAAVATGGTALRVVAEHAPLSPAKQWEDAVRGGRGVWDGAEEAVRARLGGTEK